MERFLKDSGDWCRGQHNWLYLQIYQKCQSRVYTNLSRYPTRSFSVFYIQLNYNSQKIIFNEIIIHDSYFTYLCLIYSITWELCCRWNPFSFYLIVSTWIVLLLLWEVMKMPTGNRMLPNFGHCLVEYKEMRFLIMDRPSKANIGQFVEVCYQSIFFMPTSLYTFPTWFSFTFALLHSCFELYLKNILLELHLILGLFLDLLYILYLHSPFS